MYKMKEVDHNGVLEAKYKIMHKMKGGDHNGGWDMDKP